MSRNKSIFQQLYSQESFVDRYLQTPENGVDIVIPIIHTNELWYKNLISIYREIPVNRLLLGNGGCLDDSLDIASRFPRVEIYDHTSYKTLGYSIRKLIEQVTTEWFIYLHSDVYIPENWFNAMVSHCGKYDWFECEQQMVYLVEYENTYAKSSRGFGFGGSQMGRRSAFSDMLYAIDDDYLYRNEDIIIRTLLQKHGHTWGFVDSSFHYHIAMHKQSTTGRQIEKMQFQVTTTEAEQIRTNTMQVKGYIKYLNPTAVTIKEGQACFFWLLENKAIKYHEFINWIREINPQWLPYFSRKTLLKNQLDKNLKQIYNLLFKS